MDVLLSQERYLHEIELAVRLLLASLLALPLGLEREARRHPAGLRTHMLTALAAALFTIVALELYRAVRDTSDRMTADPVRAIEAVTAGVAFLAAGAIIHSRGQVRGLTTGVSMWVAGALGLASGAGYYFVAVTTCVLALVILSLLSRLERRFFDQRESPDD